MAETKHTGYDGDRPQVVIAGGGVAALEAMFALRAVAEERVAIELVAPEPHFWYRPLAVGEPFGASSSLRFELGALTQEAGAAFTPGAVEAVDVPERLAVLRSGKALPYDALLVATGARPMPAVGGALTFRGPADADAMARVLAEAEAGAGDHLVFAAPTGSTWTLPLYELALLTDAWLRERGARDGVSITVATPEERPLQAFGGETAEAVADLLARRAVEFRGGIHADTFVDGRLSVVPRALLAASHVIALPRLEGTAPEGLPRGWGGFVPVDDFCRVRDCPSVYAAGDGTTVSIKQGGVAAQHGATAAAAIAADLGLGPEPEPFRPLLRGLLLTGEAPRYLRADPVSGEASVDTDPLWWPPAKLVARHLGPHLARLAADGGLAETAGPPRHGA